MTITTCCKIWWICHGKNIERTVDGQTDGRTVRHIVSVSVSVAVVRHRMGNVALHVTIASPSRYPVPHPLPTCYLPPPIAAISTKAISFYADQIAQMASKRAEQSDSFFLFFVVFLLNFALLFLLLLYLHLTHNKGKMPVATTTA